MNQSATKFCPKCGNQLRADTKFCARCGSPVGKQVPSLTPPPVSPPHFPLPYTPPSQQSGTSDPTQILSQGHQRYVPPTPMTPPSPPLVYQPQSYPQPPSPIPFSHTPSRVNLSQALKFPFAASNWVVTMLIGGFIMLIPILGWIIGYGYMVELIRRVVNDDYDVLPGWDNFGTKFKDGLAVFGLILVWAVLPILFLSLPGYLIMALDSEEIGMPVMLIGVSIGSFITYFFLPLVWGRYAMTNRFLAGLEVQQIWLQARKNLGRYIGNLLLMGLMLLVGITIIILLASISGALMVVLIGICITPFVLMANFYAILMQAHLMGQLYRIAS